jgi:hypothetical protein
MLDRLALAPRIRLAVIALHLFGGSVIAVTVKVDRHEGDPHSG